MRPVLRLLSSLELTISLAVLICTVSAWGSLLAMKYPRFYRMADQQILFPWLLSEGLEYPGLTLWIFILIALVSVFAVNTTICTFDRVYSIVRARRPWQTLLPHVVHVGFLVAMAGHLVGSLYGFKSPGHMVLEGETIAVPQNPGLSLRLDRIDMKATPDGDLDSLETSVTLLKDGKEVLKDAIEINGPVIYRGIAFYHLDQGKTITGLVLDVDGEDIRADFNEEFRTRKGKGFVMGALFPDFALDENGGPYSRSEEYKNPFQEIISRDGGKAYLDLSSPGTSINVSGTRIILKDFSMSHYAVLSMNKDPGIRLIIIGSAILVIGIVLIFVARAGKAELVRD